MNTSCPAITPYDWQLDLAGALALTLGATVIAGTGSKKLHFGPCLAPGTELWPDLPSHLAAEPARCGSCTAKVCVLEVTNPTIALLFLGSLLSDELRMPAVAVKNNAWNAREGSIRNVCLDAHYMRSNRFMEPTGCEIKTLPDTPDIPRDLSGRQRVHSTP